MGISSEKKFFIIGIILVVFAIGFFIWNFIAPTFSNQAPNKIGIQISKTEQEEKKCDIKETEKLVTGESLQGMIEPGTKIKILENYYACNPVKKEDIVIYKYRGSVEPLIKIVKAVPGDKLDLLKKDGGWNIIVNGEVLKNSENKPYLINETGYRILSLYIDNYKGEIPEGAYLILGNDPGGSLDSTRFGLVGKDDFIGKAFK